MTDILFSPQNNPGGVTLLHVAVVPSISNFPARTANGSITESDLVFLPNFRWFQVYGSDGSKQFTETGKQSDNGPVFEPSVRCFFPGDDPDARTQLYSWLHYPLVVRVEDAAGKLRLVGTPTEFLLLEVAYDTQIEMGGRRGTLLTFRGITTQSAAYLM
jgi:hypothetical protein